MNARAIIFGLLALMLAAGTTILANRMVSQPQREVQGEIVPQVEAVDLRRVLVASRELPAGTLIDPKRHVEWTYWPAEQVSDQVVIHPGDEEEAADEVSEVEGAFVRSRIAAGEPIYRARYVKPQDGGFLAAVLSPGTRAVSVSVDTTTAISGLIHPGDRVDLIMTHTYETSGRDRQEFKASETVLRNVRVVAVDQSTDDTAEDGSAAGGGRSRGPVVSNVTLELWPKEAEIVALASSLGTLSLSLRSVGNPADFNPDTSEERILAWLRGEAGGSMTMDREISQLISQVKTPPSLPPEPEPAAISLPVELPLPEAVEPVPALDVAPVKDIGPTPPREIVIVRGTSRTVLTPSPNQ